MTKNLLLGIAAVCGSTFQAVACTGISLTSRDGSYVQARTIEWARGVLQSEYVIIPRGQQLTSFTPTGVNGLTFTAKIWSGWSGCCTKKNFIAEGHFPDRKYCCARTVFPSGTYRSRFFGNANWK